jgi:Ca-activated chloride channel family protein
VDLNLLVLDREHHPVTGLTNSAFTITEDGAPRAIQSVAPAAGPVSLCLLIDESGSTYGVRGPIGEAAMALVRDLPAGSEVMVVNFADRAHLYLPFTPASLIPPERLTTLTSRGATAMFDGLVAAEIYLLANAHQKRRAMVLISDGGDNASNFSGEQAMQRLIRPGAPLLYALSVPNKRDSSEEVSRSAGRLKNLFELAGGLTLSAVNASDMARLAQEISAMVRGQYVVSFVPGEAVRNGKMHKLEVKITPADKHEEIHTLAGYYAGEPGTENIAK